MSKVRIISDIHGNPNLHIRLARRATHSVQLGDCGFKYGYLPSLDPKFHKVLGGNHDNYPELIKYPHYLGDFGTWEGFFYARGAWSIDQMWRVPGISWWEEEEMTYQRGYECLDEYTATKPQVVLSHDCPLTITKIMLPISAMSTRTGQLFDAMFHAHRPSTWIFGHHHEFFHKVILGTEFICVPMDTYIDYDTETHEITGLPKEK
jgi:hypothetical protein